MMVGLSNYDINRLNGSTEIIHKYFDLDAKEFVSKSEIIARYDRSTDYYSRLDALDFVNNVHNVLWTYSKTFFEPILSLQEVVKNAHNY